MVNATAYGLLIGFPLVAVLLRSWFAVVLPLVGWPIFYLGLNKRWWLYGTGDGWQSAAVFWTVIGVVSTALAVTIARRLWPPSPRFANPFANPS